MGDPPVLTYHHDAALFRDALRFTSAATGFSETLVLSVAGTGPTDVSPDKVARLRAQIETQLKPVLREADLAGFDLDRAVERVARAAHLAGTRAGAEDDA